MDFAFKKSGYFIDGGLTYIPSTNSLTVGGNLTVSGTTTTISTTNLVVEDPLIKLANGNKLLYSFCRNK